jgi:group I intron endonuclease
MKGYIYKITNLNTNKFYIGSTVDFKTRKNQHLWHLRANKHVNKYLQNSYNKHGEEFFEFKIIAVVENIKETEQEFLDNLDFTKSYNISPNSVGGDVIKTFSKKRQKEIYKKISESNKGRLPGNAISVNINGEIFKSFHKASIALNLPVTSIRYRCNSLNSKFKNWNIIGQEKDKNEMYKEGNNQGHIIICEQKEFPSYAEAARYYNMSITAIQNRVKSKNYFEFYKK